MKKTIGALAAVLVIAAFVPFFSGILMERTVRGAFQDMNALYAETGAGYTLDIIRYDRGYFTSDIEWKMDLGALKAVYPIDTVVFLEHARHGFSGVVSTTSLEKNPWFVELVDEQLEGRNPLHITTAYSLFGNIDATVAVDAFSVAIEEDILDVQPARLTITTDSELKHFNSSGSWQGLAAGDTMRIGRVSMNSSLEMISAFIWDGDVSFDIEDVAARGNAGRVDLKTAKCSYRLDVDEDRTSMSGEARFSVDGLHADSLSVDRASVRLVTNGLNVQGYEAFMRLYSQIMSQYLENMAAVSNDPEEASAAMKQQMATFGFQIAAAYEKLLKKGLEFQISDLHVDLAGGAITGDLTLRLLKDMTFMQFAPIIQQPDLLLDIIYLKSDLKLPVNLTGENPKLLAPVYPGMQTGLFVPDGDLLIHSAETVDGKLMVNGREVNLAR